MPLLGGFELGYGELGAPGVAAGPAFQADGQATAAFLGGATLFGAFRADGAATAGFAGSVTSAHARLTQLAVEALTGPGNANARLTQITVETLGSLRPGFRAEGAATAGWVGLVAATRARLTQLAVEALTGVGTPGARLTQLAVETLAARGAGFRADGSATADWTGSVFTPPAAYVKETQAALEEATWPTNELRLTAAALEAIDRPPVNDIWETQVALEVIYKGDFVGVPRYNHSFIGAWMATGGKKNASFAI